ncbi:hypothetical protein IW262DRAFT_1294630 [Armillaria fumosa]|nr:hypothetical protein IW262DRAFT_1294630 [Armillaria fumosa]
MHALGLAPEKQSFFEFVLPNSSSSNSTNITTQPNVPFETRCTATNAFVICTADEYPPGGTLRLANIRLLRDPFLGRHRPYIRNPVELVALDDQLMMLSKQNGLFLRSEGANPGRDYPVIKAGIGRQSILGLLPLGSFSQQVAGASMSGRSLYRSIRAVVSMTKRIISGADKRSSSSHVILISNWQKKASEKLDVLYRCQGRADAKMMKAEFTSCLPKAPGSD